MSATVLEQRGQLRNVIDGEVEPVAEDRDAAAAVGLDRVEDGRVRDADRLEDLAPDHVPEMHARSLAAFHVGVHRGCEHERLRAVVTHHRTRPP